MIQWFIDVWKWLTNQADKPTEILYIPLAPKPALPLPISHLTMNPDTLLPWIIGKSLTHNNWHNVRALCDLEGLTSDQKETLTACVWVESEFNTLARLDNKDKTGRIWSSDLGICQWNTYFHGNEISADKSLNDPEFSVRMMCKYWKAGKEKEWVSFTSKAYLKHVGKTL